MIQTLPNIVLKNGENVAANVVLAPEENWQFAITDLLLHKGELWRRQIAQLLSGQPEIEARFYVLHRAGVPFCNILTIENNGVGMLGHVWTKPEARGQGAASQLLRLVMEDFRARGGRALFLGTGYNSAAFHIYHKQGFQSIENQSGSMAFFRAGRDEFESEYFAPGEATIAPLNWAHYATASALLMHENKTRLRCTPLGVLRPMLCEGPFLPVLFEQSESHAARVVVLAKADDAVVGVAACGVDAIWPDILVVDIFCHANFWHRGEELLAALPISNARRLVVYDDERNTGKTELLRRAGFEKQAILKNRVARDAFGAEFLDVTLWERAA